MNLKSSVDALPQLETKEINARVEQNRRDNHAKCTAAGLDPAAVEKCIADDKILSYDTAIKYLQAQAKSVQPSHIHTQDPIAMPADAKEIQKDPRGWARRTAAAAIDELKARRMAG